MRHAALLGFLLVPPLIAACGGREAPPPTPHLAPPATAAYAAAAPVTSSVPGPVLELGDDETSPEDAERVLFLATDLRTDALRKECPASLAPRPRILCLLALRYEDVPESRQLAFTLYTETGSLAGLLPEETSSDGRGGTVHLLPARPIAQNREHLEWIIDAFRDYKRFLDGIRAKAANPGATPPGVSPAQAAGTGEKKVAFRDRPVDFRFFYTEKGGNPSMFAVRRNVGYNLFGTVNVSDNTVRDTLFHEIFHLNDARLGDPARNGLGPVYDRILGRCGKKKACLTPYAPTDTFVNGAYYAFSLPGDAKEYAAEVGLRYYREHRLVLDGKPLPVTAFKCGPDENREAWRLVAETMFGGVDLVPDCQSDLGVNGKGVQPP